MTRNTSDTPSQEIPILFDEEKDKEKLEKENGKDNKESSRLEKERKKKAKKEKKREKREREKKNEILIIERQERPPVRSEPEPEITEKVGIFRRMTKTKKVPPLEIRRSESLDNVKNLSPK